MEPKRKDMKRIYRSIAGVVLALAASLTGWAQDVDYGALPALTRPQGDQSAANQKLDFHTDLFTGRFNHHIPIEVPPGRQGSEPSIALHYDSSGGNGWCGVGWDLDMGYIQRETRHGVPLNGSSYDDSYGFIFSIGGQSGRLIRATDGTYRPEINTAFLKFVRTNNCWMMTDKSGRRYTFGGSANNQQYLYTTAFSSTFKWLLSSIQDANGNQTAFTYQTLGGSDKQLYPYAVSYNANINSASLTNNCIVYFGLDQFRPDSPNSCLSGQQISTSARLQNIWVYCNGERVRRYYLQYTTSPSTGRSLLSSIQEYGITDSRAWPAVSFDYSESAKSFQPVQRWSMTAQASYNNMISPSSPHTQLVDMNGDGLPDWVSGQYSSPYTRYIVQTNSGRGFGTTQNWAVTNETGVTSYGWNDVNQYDVPFSGGRVSYCELADINGDRLPDRVMLPGYSGSYFQVQTNTGNGFGSLVRWQGVPADNYFSAPQWLAPGTVLNPGANAEAMIVDMDGDGFTDLLMLGSTASQYSVGINQWPASANFSTSTWRGVADSAGVRNESVLSGFTAEFLDLNGDGLPDRITPGKVQLNHGDGFDYGKSWGLTNNESFAEISFYDGYFTKQLMDMNGDGLPDMVLAGGYATNGTYLVRYNTGDSFASPVLWTGVDTSAGPSAELQTWDADGTIAMFIDINGDGLVDRVTRNNQGSGTCFLVQLSSGPFPDLLTDIGNGIGGWVTVTYTNSTTLDNTDGTRPRLGMPMQVVSSVQSGDGFRTASTKTYSYSGGFYDTIFREFRGFGIVSEASPNGMGSYLTNVTYFHQGGGRNLSSHGEYQDSRFKAGMAFDAITYGANGLPYKEIRSQITQVQLDTNGIYFPFVTNVFVLDTEVPGQTRTTLKQYAYAVFSNNLAASTGNLIRESALGEVSNLQTNYSYSPGADTPLFTAYTYASLSNPNIVDKPTSITISTDTSGTNILRQTQYQYYGDTGDLQEKSELVCPGTYANTFYTYDDYGNLRTVTDPVGIVTTTDYDAATATFPWRTVTGSLTNTVLHDPRNGSVLAATNAQGMVTANSYDPLLRLTNSAMSTTAYGAPSLTRTKYVHWLGGVSQKNYVRVSQYDPAASGGFHDTLTYMDGYGRPIQIREESETNNIYRVTDIFYSTHGALLTQCYPIFASGSNYVATSGTRTNTYTKFDAIGRPNVFYPLASASISGGVLAAFPTPLNGDASSPVGPVSVAFHDGNNPWAIVVTNALNQVHKFLLDSLGRTNQIVEVTSAGNYTTTLQYNPVGDLTNIVDHAGNSMVMFYDLRGQRVALADPDMGLWQYGFDLAGRLKTQTDAKGQKIKFYYNDAAGRLTRREAWSAANQCVSTNTWAYDSSGGDAAYAVFPGQTYAVTDDEGWQKYSYDVRNRTLKSVRYLAKNNTSYTNQFTFDDADRLTAATLPNDGPTLTNLFDAGGHLKTVAQGATNFYTAKGFNALNQLNGVNFGNGVATTYGYYTVSKRLQQITTASIQSLAYKYDAVGNITNIADGVYTGNASATVGKIQYDDLNRLMSLTNANGSFSYAYSPIGNVLTNKESGSNSYTYGTIRPHCVRNANGVDYTYDLNGNVSMRGKQHLFHDANNRLCKVWNTNGVITTFGYAADGARLWEQSGTNALQVWIGGNYEEKDGQILYHIYADGRQVCTFDKTGTNVWQYYHPDNLGSTAIQSDKGGSLIQSFTYSAFGQSRYTLDANLFKPSRRYTGQVLDEGTGLYYYNFRYYIPELARFAEGDDIIPDLANPQSYNRYSYVMNNPLRYTDPSGHAGWEQGLDNLADALAAASPPQAVAVERGTVGVIKAVPKSTRALAFSAKAVAKGSAAAVKETGGLIKAVTEVVESSSRLKAAEKMAASSPKAKAAEEGQMLFRGVPGNGTEKANLGAQGIAKPRGTAIDPRTLENHVMGADANAGVTSWTPDRNVAKSFSGNDGTIIEVNKSAVADKIVPRPPVQKYGAEKEVLLKGTIQGNPTKP
jgi:RHS repeat-associated protein